MTSMLLISHLASSAARADCQTPNGVEGQIVYNKDHGIPQYCDGSDWWGMGWKNQASAGSSTPAGAVMAFDLATCPTGWSAYTPAQGRFIRGIDPAGTTDPSGVRVAGNTQMDALQGHWHQHYTGTQIVTTGTSGRAAADYSAPAAMYGPFSGGTRAPITDGTNGTPRIASETRPVNVALLYCRKD